MSLSIHRKVGESFVLIDDNDPESFAIVTITEAGYGNSKVAIDAPGNVHIVRREILHRYPEHKEVLSALEKMSR